jgi:hypothetical protein
MQTGQSRIAETTCRRGGPYVSVRTATYRRYRPSSIDEAAARAMNICPTDLASAIPVLEDHIITMKVPLRSRVLARS